MNERQEQTADVLGKLTVLGTIVLPMNIICGMWGMNVKVPGQDEENLYWFWSSKCPIRFTQRPTDSLSSVLFSYRRSGWVCGLLLLRGQACLWDCLIDLN
jgi:hypothetical protein